MDLSILYSEGSQANISNFNIDTTLKIVANSADPDEMLHYAAFHLGQQCLPKYLFASVQNEKGYDVFTSKIIAPTSFKPPDRNNTIQYKIYLYSRRYKQFNISYE